MADPRRYLPDKAAPPAPSVVQINAVDRTAAKKRSPLPNLPLEPWSDNQFWHSAKDAAGILQQYCGKEGFSYESLLGALENEYIKGFHWFKRGGTYKGNIWRMIKFPPGRLDL